jgi:hypothetical protein
MSQEWCGECYLVLKVDFMTGSKFIVGNACNTSEFANAVAKEYRNNNPGNNYQVLRVDIIKLVV